MEHDTETPAANDTERPPPIIRAGEAQQAVSAALTRLVEAYVELEATSMAIARQLDATAPPEAP
jgi:hypothetical protein